jgi:hypothetical protein
MGTKLLLQRSFYAYCEKIVFGKRKERISHRNATSLCSVWSRISTIAVYFLFFFIAALNQLNVTAYCEPTKCNVSFSRDRLVGKHSVCGPYHHSHSLTHHSHSPTACPQYKQGEQTNLHEPNVLIPLEESAGHLLFMQLTPSTRYMIIIISEWQQFPGSTKSFYFDTAAGMSVKTFWNLLHTR